MLSSFVVSTLLAGVFVLLSRSSDASSEPELVTPSELLLQLLSARLRVHERVFALAEMVGCTVWTVRGLRVVAFGDVNCPTPSNVSIAS